MLDGENTLFDSVIANFKLVVTDTANTALGTQRREIKQAELFQAGQTDKKKKKKKKKIDGTPTTDKVKGLK